MPVDLRKRRRGKCGPPFTLPSPALAQAALFLTVLVPLMWELNCPPPHPSLPIGLALCPQASMAPRGRYLDMAFGTLQTSPPCSHQPALLSLLSRAPFLILHGAGLCFPAPGLVLASHLPGLHAVTKVRFPGSVLWVVFLDTRVRLWGFLSGPLPPWPLCAPCSPHAVMSGWG